MHAPPTGGTTLEPPHIDAIVDGVARFLARALQIRNDDVVGAPRGGKCTSPTLLQTLEHEERYTVHNEQLARLSMLMDTDAFARATAQLAMLLLEASHGVPSVCLLPFAECEGFFDYRDYIGWQRNEYIRLGGLQLAFQHEVVSYMLDRCEWNYQREVCAMQLLPRPGLCVLHTLSTRSCLRSLTCTPIICEVEAA